MDWEKDLQASADLFAEKAKEREAQMQQQQKQIDAMNEGAKALYTQARDRLLRAADIVNAAVHGNAHIGESDHTTILDVRGPPKTSIEVSLNMGVGPVLAVNGSRRPYLLPEQGRYLADVEQALRDLGAALKR